MFRKASKCVWNSTVVVPPDPLSLTPSASSAMKTLGIAEEDCADPEPIYVAEIQMGYYADSL
jgi:hypothetical protein